MTPRQAKRRRRGAFPARIPRQTERSPGSNSGDSGIVFPLLCLQAAQEFNL